ncbi:hypothetical protein ACSLVQ_28060, partial [Klebsiella pneumoniae]|uniref:hypothetical protein n=1 Tax=Klebsiella pneumoniae TaxID=573 RepID=UPI003EE26D65
AEWFGTKSRFSGKCRACDRLEDFRNSSDRGNLPGPDFIAFSSREPVPTSPENAPGAIPATSGQVCA